MGCPLWARNPEYLEDIVYRMRFDEASAKYAEFGPFYTSYIATAESFKSLRDLSRTIEPEPMS